MACKYLTRVALLFIVTVTGLRTLDAQENDSLIQRRIRQQQYVFVAQTFSSQSTSARTLVGDFQVKVTADSVAANLPYFGQSYSPQFGRSTDDEGIRFISTSFEYSAVAKKKGRWEITIKPKDSRGTQMFLTVYSNGESKMEVTSPRKETMLFNGYVW